MENVIKNDLFMEAMNLAIQYLKNREQGTILRRNMSPPQLSSEFKILLLETGNNSEYILDLLEKSLNYRLNTSHPLFMNQLFGGANLVAILGDIFKSILNTSMYTYEVAPLMTLIEKECIQKLGEMIGYQSGRFDGTFTAGGSVSNMLAMILARDKKFLEAMDKGLKETLLFSIFVSEQAHYSFLKSARILGFGNESIVKIVTDDTGRIKADALTEAKDSYDFDLVNRSLQCCRRPDAFKLWLAWKYEGNSGFEKRVNTLVQKALTFAKKLRARKNFELFNVPETPVVCFQYKPDGLSQEMVNDINKKIREKIFEEGKIIFNYPEIKGKTVLRCVISNPEITEEQIDNKQKEAFIKLIIAAVLLIALSFIPNFFKGKAIKKVENLNT